MATTVEWLGPQVRIHPTGALRAAVRPPGSKSLTNRYLTCAALARGRSRLREASLSDDAQRMAAGLRALGLPVEIRTDRREITLDGGRGNLPVDEAEINAGDAGTAMRFLTALACVGHGHYRLDGSPRMRERPIGPLVNALHELGAEIGYDAVPGCPPLTVAARGLTGGSVVFQTPPSSQYISAILMVAPYAGRDVLLKIEGGAPSRPYIDMTLKVMRSMGVEVLESDGRRWIVPEMQMYQAADVFIEPDASAAAYFWAAAAVTGGRVRVLGLDRGSAQGDVHFVDVLERMGCRIHAGADFLEVEGPPPGELRGVDEDLNEMPDTAQTLAVTALFAAGPTRVRNVANLRIKETDRLSALGTELTRFGARVDIQADGLTIHPPKQIQPAEIQTYNDHRMAMSFAIAGLAAEGVTIQNAGCVSKSFPDFFEVLDSLAAGGLGY